MGRLSDLRILYHMVFKRGRGKNHAERLDNFYAGQAKGYDDFRKRMLKGRSEMMNVVVNRVSKDLLAAGNTNTQDQAVAGTTSNATSKAASEAAQKVASEATLETAQTTAPEATDSKATANETPANETPTNVPSTSETTAAATNETADATSSVKAANVETANAAAPETGKPAADLSQLIWVDMGGGTGANLEYIADKIPHFKRVYIVDLASSLLEIAQKRIDDRGWTNVTAVNGDATTYTPEEGYADIVTFSYSLTMIPDWFAALDNALRILKPGGILGIVDFYVARKWSGEGHHKQSKFTRHYWPMHFSTDNVYLSHDHIPYLERHFETLDQEEYYSKIPYIPIVRVPYYLYLGRKPEQPISPNPYGPIPSLTPTESPR